MTRRPGRESEETDEWDSLRRMLRCNMRRNVTPRTRWRARVAGRCLAHAGHHAADSVTVRSDQYDTEMSVVSAFGTSLIGRLRARPGNARSAESAALCLTPAASSALPYRRAFATARAGRRPPPARPFPA